jgi:O-antigen ligase
LYRYQGRTERSLQTGFVRQGNIDQLTTGRFTIFKSDVNMFLAYPVLGVGLGESMKQRHKFDGPAGHAAHLEISRLLAEHGLPGLFLVFLIYFVPFFVILREPNNYRRSVMLAFVIMALTATFHSAMRTMATPLLFSFAFIKYVPTEFDWQAALKRGNIMWKQQAQKMKMAGRRLQKQKEAMA